MRATLDSMMQPTLGAFDPNERHRPMPMSTPRGFAKRGVFGGRREMNFRGRRFNGRGIRLRGGAEDRPGFRPSWRPGWNPAWQQVPRHGYGAMPPNGDAGFSGGGDMSMDASQQQWGNSSMPAAGAGDDSQSQTMPQQQDAGGYGQQDSGGQDQQQGGRRHRQSSDQGGGMTSDSGGGFSLQSIPTWGWVAGGLGALLLLSK
jgi:hypothetical protein